MAPCALGCTEACPAGAKAHAEVIRSALLPRIRREWWPLRRTHVTGSGTVRNTIRQSQPTPTPKPTEPGALPKGWHVRAALPEERTGRPGEHLFLAHAPARTTAPSSPAGAPVRLPGLWALIDHGFPGEGNSLLLLETNLWRLWLFHRETAVSGAFGFLSAADVDVTGWLAGLIADLADPDDEAEQAERTLYLLGGRWRTPPAAALR